MVQNSATEYMIALTTVMKQAVLMVGMIAVLLCGLLQNHLPKDARMQRRPPPQPMRLPLGNFSSSLTAINH